MHRMQLFSVEKFECSTQGMPYVGKNQYVLHGLLDKVIMSLGGVWR